MKRIFRPKIVGLPAKVGIFLIIAALIIGFPGSYSVDGDNSQPSQNLEIYTWYDLDDVRDNLSGYHILMNDLNSTTPGYTLLASPTANEEKGWQPIGYSKTVRSCGAGVAVLDYYLRGVFDGQGHEIRDLFINRPDENGVGLFYSNSGSIINLGVTNATVTGASYVGCLVGRNDGNVKNSYSSGTVNGESVVGGLVGHNHKGTVLNSYSSGNVNGSSRVGGLVGSMYYGRVENSHSMCNVIGEDRVGGLVGYINYEGIVSNSYSTGNVIGDSDVGGLVGLNSWADIPEVGGGTVSDSYSTGNVNGNQNVGGLVGHNYYGTISNSYSTGNVNGNQNVGGLVGHKSTLTTMSNSFWDTETSGQATSDGGTGKNTTEMQNNTTFSGVGWNIIAVANTTMRDSLYIWNIVNNVTYPFLSWQS